MGGCRCSYKNCANTPKTRENLHFFHYPVKHKERCKQWIENANKPQFYNLDEDQLRNKVVCETHFEDRHFLNAQKKRLLQGSIPTLEGDCEPPPVESSHQKVNEDIEVLRANEDGTIFVLETNEMSNTFASEAIETYIYTNNGLVLPVSNINLDHNLYDYEEDKPADKNTIVVEEKQEVIEVDEIETENIELFSDVGAKPLKRRQKRKKSPPPVVTSVKILTPAPLVVDEVEIPQVVEEVKPTNELTVVKQTVDLDDKYVNKIKQHSRDIAILKRMLRNKAGPRRPRSILNMLRRRIPPSLLSIVSLNLTSSRGDTKKDNVAPDKLEFFSTIYNTSPEVYDVLAKKYKWNLPSPDTLGTGSQNGHLESQT